MELIDKQYKVVKALGQGLAGEVYLVQKDAQKLALKLLKATIANLSPQEAESHFKAEFSILKQLSHPHIAKIMDFGIDAGSGRQYFTSELVEGKDLYSETREAGLPELEEFFIQSLRALEYLQSHGVSHYDLKPENLLVDKKNRQVKIIDFGLAGFKPRGQLAGTPAYMAPELALGNRPDSRADLYSLGVTFYECLTGKNPFRAKGLSETLRRQETLNPPAARELNKEIPEALSDVLAQLMMKNPADRPGTAGAALRAYSQLSAKPISLETEATRLSYLPNETKLIGRDREIRAFQALLDSIRNPAGEAASRWLIVTGETGVGKSRLLKEIRFHAQLAGVRTLSLARGEPPEVTETSCIFYDELDAGELQQLRFAAFSLPHPCLIVAACRETPSGMEDAEILQLKPFTLPDIRSYLAALTGLANPPDSLAQELEKRTHGSPQFMTEILSELIRHGSLLDERGRWSAATLEDLGVDFRSAKASAKLEESFQQDLHQLDPPAAELLKWVAVAPAGVSAETLEAASAQEDLPYWLLEMINRAYLQRDEASQAYQISNPLMKEWIRKGLDPADRARRHAAWAKVLQKLPSRKLEFLYHLGRGGTGAAEREALIDLAREQDKKGQFQDALENLRIAEQFPDLDAESKTQIALKVGEELISMNDLKAAQQHFDELRAQLEKLPGGEAVSLLKVKAYEKLGATYLRWNQLDKAKVSIDSGIKLLQALKKPELGRQLIFQNYLGRIRLQEGKLKEARDIFASTAKQAQELDAASRKLVINNDLGMVLLGLGKTAEASEQFERDLKFYQEIGNEYLQAKCLYNLGESEYALKRYDQTIRHYKRCVELSKSQKNLEMLLRAYNGLGNVYHLRHDYAESLHYYERALAIAQKTGDFLSQAGIEINLGTILNLTNRPAKAIPHLKAVIHLLEGLKSRGVQEKYFLANAKLELGDVYRRLLQFTEGQGMLEAAQQVAASDPNLSGLSFPIRITLAKLALDQGKVEQARKIHAQLEASEPNEEQKIELAKLANLLERPPAAAEREPAVTQGALEYSRQPETTVYQSSFGEGNIARLLELTRFINAETNLDYVLKSVLQYALELSGAERGLILLLDENDRLEVRATINTALNPNLTDISSRVAEQTLLGGEIVESDDASQDERFNEYQSVMVLKLRSILCLPIHSRNKTVGVLYLDHRYRPGAFTKARYPILQAFCDQAGIAIENAKLFEQYERAQAELKQRLQVVQEEVEHYHELLGEKTGKLPTKYAYENIVARAKPMYEVFKVLDKITETNISVFINGETGTGKELIAKALHYNNPGRGKARFVAINCGGIPPNLIESELFGYKAGAFTGASRDKKGLFAEADGGTLFMDEVADLDLALQVKLLRALEEGEVIPVGDTKPIRFDVRVVSASHKRLEDLIRDGSFREDLYYRICQIRISLPALRDRKEDIPLLIEKFATDYGKQHRWKKAPKVSGGLMKKFLEYSWPGNIRELENTIRVACALSEGAELTAKHLPDNFGMRQLAADSRGGSASAAAARPVPQAESAPRSPIDAHNAYDSRRSWEDYERLIFAKSYETAGFKPLDAAEALDVSSATFYKRIKDFDLNNRANQLYQDPFQVTPEKKLREYLEDVFWAAYQSSGEKAYTAIKWLGVSQGHFYNVLKSAKQRHAKL